MLKSHTSQDSQAHTIGLGEDTIGFQTHDGAKRRLQQLTIFFRQIVTALEEDQTGHRKVVVLLSQK